MSGNQVSQEIKEVIKVFIASSAELKDEREGFLHVFNSINKYLRHLELEAVRWETDIESGSYDKPKIQDEITPLLESCPIVFALFFSKLGKFTLEEYRLAEQENKKVFVYFKKGFSPRKIDEIEDYKNVLEFRESLEKENRTSCAEYESIEQLHNLVQKDINLYLSRNYNPKQVEKTTELDEYRKEVHRIDVNQKASTSEALLRNP